LSEYGIGKLPAYLSGTTMRSSASFVNQAGSAQAVPDGDTHVCRCLGHLETLGLQVI
jgi:hypothetical protein